MTNLSYNYTVTHLPVYASAKATFNNKSDQYAITLDAGIGPNFIKTGGFEEHSLDGGITIPEQDFSGKTNATFSATAGLGLKLNNVLGSAPLECGYRFFYLGQGELKKQASQIQNTLSTGSNFGNALTCSVTI